ncbi:hypothetical protein ACHAWU_007845 [Discostella pseudostelligera]|uniref:Peptidase M11 gametolysin domain-containing protein n=1 Tax=Discostella pseudostelligera TaxID=259834 RepID=A0ABD3M9W5_9STRA
MPSSSHRIIGFAVLLIGSILRADAALRGKDTFVVDLHDNVIHRRVLQESQLGVYLVKDIEYDDRVGLSTRRELGQTDRPKRTANIQLPDGTTYEVKNAQAGWASKLKSGKFNVHIPPGAVVSSDGTIDIKGMKLDASEIFGNRGGNGNGLFDRNLLEVDDAAITERTPEQQRNLAALQSSRALQSGTRTVLAVRIFLTDGQYSFTDQAGLSNDVFGNGVDPSNLKSQYAACSANKLIFDKASDRSMTSNPNDGTTAISNGVVDIKVALAVAPESDGAIVNAVTSKINSVFGVGNPNQLANHIMYCLPSGTMKGIAYAYINSWNSVYSNEWCNYVSGQMHEIGHNLGYAHSNEGGQSYADQTGMMGYSYGLDDGPTMCFNAAKSWQTQWYASKSTTVDPSASSSAQNCFEGKLYGIADFSNAASTVVLAKIDDASATDYFVTFNRQTGMNSGTQEAGNLVTITTTGNEGISYSESSLLAKLGAGGSWSGTIDGKTMVVNVLSITTSSSPGYATVRVSENGNPCVVSNAPTRLPTTPPSSSPTRLPTTPPSSSPTTGSPSSTPTTASPTTELPTLSPSVSESPSMSQYPTEFPTVSPSTHPTMTPTMSPTMQPTNLPTPKPSTATPSRLPTRPPTAKPTKRVPTRKPTRKPTVKPTTNAAGK